MNCMCVRVGVRADGSLRLPATSVEINTDLRDIRREPARCRKRGRPLSDRTPDGR